MVGYPRDVTFVYRKYTLEPALDVQWQAAKPLSYLNHVQVHYVCSAQLLQWFVSQKGLLFGQLIPLWHGRTCSTAVRRKN